MFPTNTGISLTEDEWRELTAHPDDISEELKEKTKGTNYHIGNEICQPFILWGERTQLPLASDNTTHLMMVFDVPPKLVST